jgi:hypothetical protein
MSTRPVITFSFYWHWARSKLPGSILLSLRDSQIFCAKTPRDPDCNYYKNISDNTERRKNKGQGKEPAILSIFSDGRLKPIQTTAKQGSSSISKFCRLEKKVFIGLLTILKVHLFG